MIPKLVLVEPAGPLNVGSVARLCRNYGIEDLRLVAPRCDPLGEEARLMAVKGLPLLQRATVFPTLAAALADCGRVVAASGRPEGEPLPLEDPEDALAWLLAGEQRALPSALVFGREDRGLSNDELLQAGRLLQIPTPTAHGSLNLSHAVAVVLHDLHRLGRRGPARVPPPSPPAAAGEGPCPRGVLEAMLDDARELLLEVGFLLPHTAAARMAKLRALLQRGQVSGPEVALLRGMVCQLRWASRRPFPSAQDH
ncbi:MULTISPECIES: RNA methyltransferase [Cyanophyceae]|uniref:rRNA methyltransferase n=1 Tax=Aphanothece cf. minutissima CCALA 015 TaxID=2107695 RepID=A0ABX5FCA2_9CHRO|nr:MULTISPECIES: TrmH family RNA methyltransferase [Cyanophyceae]MCP9797365.1 RNA methyltransferase [Cyanobium sp. Lug-B]PSB38354.1 rRNA methyltransferase [Aphanothece cf. minutissima CCALA 015]